MKCFNEHCKEVVLLSDLLYKEKFKKCFLEHFTDKVKELCDSLTYCVDVKILQRLQLKLLEPLMLHIKTSEKSDEKCLILHSLNHVLKLSLIDDVNVFFHLYTLLFFQLLNDGKLNYQISEELKMSVLDCGKFLIKNLTQDVIEKVYRVESAAKLSIGISVSVQIAKEERNNKLRLSALDFLLIATQYQSTLKYNEGIFKKIGDLFMLYLPGTIGPLQEIILRDETQQYLITVKALSCWGHILCLVMCDLYGEENIMDNDKLKEWLRIGQVPKDKLCIDVEKALMEKQRTKRWLEAAAIILKPLFLKMPEVRKHSNAKCRLALAQVMAKLLQNCTINLRLCLTPIIEVLVSFAVDEDEQVCQVARKALTEFEAHCSSQSHAIFVSIIEENLYLLVNKLPGIIHSGNEKLMLPSVKSMLGYLRILGRNNHLKQLIGLSSTLKKILVVIQIGFELELYEEISKQDFSKLSKFLMLFDHRFFFGLNVVEPLGNMQHDIKRNRFSFSDDLSSNNWSKLWKRFRHFADHSIESYLQDICHTLGEFGESEAIFDYLIDVFQREQASRKELLLVLNQIILGVNEIRDHNKIELLDFFLDPNNLYPILEADESACISLREAQSNIIQVALIMEGIGNLAQKSGKSFQDHLLRSLYYVIERIGSSFFIIREEAKKSAVKISQACGFNGKISSLIQNNVDYLTYHLTTKLKRNNSSVFDVIAVLMENSSFETLPDLEEIVNAVLKRSSENLDSPHTISYLRLFQTFVICVKKWIKTSDDIITRFETIEESEINQFLNFMNELNSAKEEKIDGEEDLNTKDEEPIYEELEKSKLPRHIKMTLSISNHCLHFLSSKNKSKKLIVLEILNESVVILADWENDLLPLVHKIWSPLVTKFDQWRDPLLTNRSFSLLCALARTSKQFIRTRTLKNVLPELQYFLIKEAPNSRLKDSSSGYYFSQNFKLQRELLENLGMLVTDLGLFEKQTDLIAQSCRPYLSSLQPRELQEKCKSFFCHLQTYNPFLVWVTLHNFTNDPEYIRNVDSILSQKK